MNNLRAEWHFIKGLFALNLASAMEYRASFWSQIFGMVLNNTIMLVFWFFFFDRFGAVRGYDFSDLSMLYGIAATGFGLTMIFTGNIYSFLAYIIAQGRLDYYLVFPRNLLVHVIFSRMHISPIGDVIFGLVLAIWFIPKTPAAFGLLAIGVVLGALIISAYGIIAGSLAFFWGNAQHASQQMLGTMLTFSLYPDTLFQGAARLLLTTVMPAFFIGAVPARLVKTAEWNNLGVMVLVVVVAWIAAVTIFYGGLRRYESGSAINVNS